MNNTGWKTALALFSSFADEILKQHWNSHPARRTANTRNFVVAPVIEALDLCKTYEAGLFSSQSVEALKDVNFSINAGEIFGYLGPNGSGKTTTIKMLLGLIFPTSGTMKILGREDIAAYDIRMKIGFLPEGAYYPEFLKGAEILRFYGKLYGMRGKALNARVDEVLDVVGMTHARKRLLRGYSKGMRQRIGLAQALLSDPEILILDEPTTGLDPVARKEMRDILASLRDQGKTLLISSHELNEVELISDRVAILDGGQMRVTGTLDDLLTERGLTMVVEEVGPEAKAKLNAANIQTDDEATGRVLLRVPSSMSTYEAMEACKQAGLNVTSIAPRRETLEELFVRTVGAPPGEESAATAS